MKNSISTVDQKPDDLGHKRKKYSIETNDIDDWMLL